MGNITSSVMGPAIFLIVGSLLVACFAVIKSVGGGRKKERAQLVVYLLSVGYLQSRRWKMLR